MNTKNQDIKIIAKKIIDLMQDKKVKDIVILDVRKLTSLTDYFILCTSESTKQNCQLIGMSISSYFKFKQSKKKAF